MQILWNTFPDPRLIIRIHVFGLWSHTTLRGPTNVNPTGDAESDHLFQRGTTGDASTNPTDSRVHVTTHVVPAN
ncbi:hypothetical protein CsSME_00011551 [Camellia sinensis var. sinensis]